MNLRIPDNPLLFALRDDTDELVTDENLREKIRDKVPLKYVLLVLIRGCSLIIVLQARQRAAHRGRGTRRQALAPG